MTPKPTTTVTFHIGNEKFFHPAEFHQVPPIGAVIRTSGTGEVVKRYKVVGHEWGIELKSDFSPIVIGVDEVYVELEEI